MILLAHETSVPWSELLRWSPARRMAALVVIRENQGGKMNWRTGQMDWPKIGGG